MPRTARRSLRLRLKLTVATAAAVALAASAAADARGGPFPIARSPHTRLALGVTTWSLALNVVQPWKTTDLREVNQFEHEARDHARIVLWYVEWAHSNLTLAQLRAVAARHSTPEITWEPWDSFKPPQHTYTLADIAAGRYDSYVRSVARLLRRFRRPVLLRFAQEMNGGWYPWSVALGKSGARAAQFVAAWRHVHGVFTRAGARNVRWVWSPVAAGHLASALYPGDRYVDVLGVSGFNGGSAIKSWGGWRSFSHLFVRSIAALHGLSPQKPIQISEVGCTETGGNKARWIKQMFATLRGLPYVTSLVWFNLTQRSDWPIDSSRAAARAFAAGLRTLPAK